MLHMVDGCPLTPDSIKREGFGLVFMYELYDLVRVSVWA